MREHLIVKKISTLQKKLDVSDDTTYYVAI